MRDAHPRFLLVSIWGTVGDIKQDSVAFPAGPPKGAVVSSPVLLGGCAARPCTRGPDTCCPTPLRDHEDPETPERSFTERGWVYRVLTSKQPALGLNYSWALGRRGEKVGDGGPCGELS